MSDFDHICCGCHDAELNAEIERLRAENDRLRQDRADALNVRSKDGLLSSEWLLRTGKAERRAEQAEERLAKAVEAAREVLAHINNDRQHATDFPHPIYDAKYKLEAAIAAAQPEDHLAECERASKAKPEKCRHEARERQGGQVVCADCFHVIAAQPEEKPNG